MRSYKTKAIILKQYEVGEADRIIIAFSRDLGLITLSAKGVRKILAKLKGHLELFNYSFLLIHKSRSAIDTITGAETIQSFKQMRRDLRSTSRIYLIGEFLNRALPEREIHPEIFKLLIYLLREFEKGAKRSRRLILISYFLLRSLKYLGYAPHFRECIHCQKKLKKGGNYFYLLGGGTVCPDCSINFNQEFKLDLEKISDKALIGLRLLNENEGTKLSKIKASSKVLEEMAGMIEKYAEHILEAELKSKRFIKQVD